MPGYRPPSTEPRGKWAKRIHEKRRAEGLSQTGAFELLRERLGYGPKSRFSYVALDMGTREPTDAEAKVLAEWLGGYPDDMADSGDATTATSELAALVKELAEQNRLLRILMANAGLLPPSPDDVIARATAAVDEAEDAAARERPRSTLQRRRSGRDRRGGGAGRPASQEDVSA